ncbi:MAG TPA: quinol:cytochrome C oxidoreductase [Bacteroidota bacterium]|nr:quinol:cytochrome C oxidoreductase [Bacteroidota bacterium]
MSTNPVTYQKKELPGSVTSMAATATIAGLILVLLTYWLDHSRGLFNNIIGLSVMASVSVGALFYVALEYLSGAVWSTPFRRVMEFLAASVFGVILLAIPLYMNLHEVFLWTHVDALARDTVLLNKTPYLNVQFFFIRGAVFAGLWLMFYWVLTRNSRKQDATGDQSLTRMNIRFSTAFMPIFAITITFFAIDWMMSLEPHWFSTIFGVYYFSGTVLAALAVATFIIVSLNERGYLVAGLKKDHYYSLGTLLFVFTNFWAYIAFSQFMLIWYANVPEETFWFVSRWRNGWQYVSYALILGRFIVPYFVLLSQPSKMDVRKLKFMGIWIFVAHILDIYWIVMPSFSRSLVLGWQELGFPILITGLIGLIFVFKSKRENLVPIADPKLQRGINFRL